MWLPSGSRSMNSSGAPGVAHRLRVDVEPPSGAQPRVLGQDVRRLHADPAAAGLAAHRRVEREAGPRAGRGDLQPAVLAVLAEARVAAHLEAELLGVEGEGGVLVGDGEHGHADVVDGGREEVVDRVMPGGRRGRTELIASGAETSRCPRFAGSGRGKYPGMEHQKGEYLDMDEGKRHQLDQQAEEYVDDVAEQPAMNAAPGARHPTQDADTADSPRSSGVLTRFFRGRPDRVISGHATISACRPDVRLELRSSWRRSGSPRWSCSCARPVCCSPWGRSH